jgi:hypothetical protein
MMPVNGKWSMTKGNFLQTGVLFRQAREEKQSRARVRSRAALAVLKLRLRLTGEVWQTRDREGTGKFVTF